MRKCKQISLLMSIVILIASVCSTVNAGGTLQQASDAVIDAELRNILQSSAATDQIPVDIWLYDPVSSEELEKAISSRIGTTREQLTTNKDRGVTSKEVDAYIEAERTLYAEKMNQHYDELLKDYSNVKALCETREGKRLFFSQYAPMISAELMPQEIKRLAADSRVESIYYNPDAKMVEDSDISIPTIGANYTRDTLGYTGSGIKIGMIEPGLPRNPHFSNIVYDTTVSANYSDHASAVAAIMVTQITPYNRASYEGIVPDATLYATHCTGRDWRIGVEWLLSQGVHVINMSCGFYDNLGQYDHRAKWVDHIAINHNVHFVKTAGNKHPQNNPQNQINSPGMAYNAITVGAIDDKNTPDYPGDELKDKSSRNETIGTQEPAGTNKPDLVAPGENIITDIKITEDTEHIGEDYVASGTSFAAPHVTAVVAQLCQREPELKLLQDAMKAILTASVSHDEIRYNTMDGDTNLNSVNDNYNKCGAGVLNARSAFSTVVESRYESGSFAANSGDGTQVMYTFNVTDIDKTIRISLSWLKCSVFADGESHDPENLITGSLANLNLYVYDSEGEVVYEGEKVRSRKIGINTEIVEFKPTRTGTHRIYIRQSTQSNKRVYYGVAWWHPMPQQPSRLTN